MRAALVFALALTLAPPLHAQGWIEPGPRPIPGFGVTRVRTAVAVRITDRVAHVEVDEWFRNDGAGLAEGDYLYPLPGEAVFADFSLFQGDEELRGEMLDGDRAREIYESIVRRRKDPALIELAGHGLVRARVFPIGPGETRRITLRYTQLLDRAGDALHFRYAAGGRYGHARRLPDDDVGPRPDRGRDRAPITFTLTAEEGARFREPFSPTHTLRTSRDGGRLVVRTADDPAGDLSIFLPLARGEVGITVATHRPNGGEDGYFMLTLSPGEVREATTPRDIAVVLDISGSMAGTKIDEARQALRQILGALGRDDRFRLIAFNGGVTVHDPDWRPATAAARAEAARWVDRLVASGGTNIAGALEEAFRQPSPDSRLPIVVFLTDGHPSTGERNPERIAERAERLRGRARVFAFGVGYDVNTYLLDRLTAAGRGTTEYLEPGENLEDALSTLAAKIRHPVLTDLAIADAPVRLVEVYPVTLPDLFAGEDLIVFGRYQAARGDRTGEVRIAGSRAGRTERFATEATFPAHAPGNDFIPRLWAARKVGELSRRIRLDGADPELVEELRETALRYGILSEYTAYLVQEPGLVAEDARQGRAFPGTAPAPFSPGSAAAPPAPSASTGQAAVRAAEAARLQREARTGADLAMAAEKMALQEIVVATTAEFGEPGDETRVVAGRVFRLRDGTWTDARHRDELRTVEIEPFGDAYFALLRALPELREIVAQLDRVLVAGERVAIRIAPGGARSLTAAEVAKLVTEFRRR